ncbi:hypothetical protein Pelo_1810 [Pelomyxa schiedti]|nr:hypothetical protein Pelo_1810 [Pelomyxa schiedti]
MSANTFLEMGMQLNAREQLMALMMASHNRCGASSPARHFASLPLTTSQLWDWCLHDTEVVFDVSAQLGFPCSPCSYFTIGVSAALMSITRGLELVARWTVLPIDVDVVDPDAFVVISHTAGHTKGVSLKHLGSQKPRLLFTDENSGSEHYNCSNHKWWLHYDDERNPDYCALTVVDLLVPKVPDPDQELPQRRCTTADVNILKTPDKVLQAITLSNFDPDEALIVLASSTSRQDRFRLFFNVIDVKETLNTGTLTVLSETACEVTRSMLPTFLTTLVLNRTNGERVFLYEYLECQTYSTVLEVAESTGTCQLLATEVKCLSRLGTFSYCIFKVDKTVEIWDCNNVVSSGAMMMKPLRVLQPIWPNESLYLVIACSGCIFYKIGKSVEVTGPTGANSICKIDFSTEVYTFTVTSSIATSTTHR